MRRPITILSALLLALGVYADEPAPQAPAADPGVVVVCPIDGDIEPGVTVVVERAIAEAEKMGARAIVFRIDTFGGRVDSAVDIATAITGTSIRSVAYIEGRGAISAGALISFACDDIVMTSGSSIGAATPVIQTTEGMQPTGEKEVSFMRAKMRALAESNGHSPDLAQAMVDKDIELRAYKSPATGKTILYTVDGTVAPESESAPGTNQLPKNSGVEDILRTLTGDTPAPTPPAPEPDPTTTVHEAGSVVYEDGSRLVLASGKLLTITPSEAMEFGLIPVIVTSLDSALLQFDLGGAELYTITPNWAEKTFRFLTSPTIAGILLMIGLGALYFEVKTAGFGVAGIVGIIALTLLFGAHFVLGVADTIDIVLILAGFILILVEVFVIPGFGIAGVAGILCVLVGTYLSLVNFTIPEYSWEYARLDEVIYSLSLAGVTFGLFVLVSWKLFPRSPLYSAFVLEKTESNEQGYTSPIQDRFVPSLGMRGTTTSMLRPSGRAKFNGATLQVVSRGAFIPLGVEVEIIEIDGGRYVVEATEANA